MRDFLEITKYRIKIKSGIRLLSYDNGNRCVAVEKYYLFHLKSILHEKRKYFHISFLIIVLTALKLTTDFHPAKSSTSLRKGR